MAEQIISPLALWEKFCPSEGEFHISLVRERDDGVSVRRGYYYDAFLRGDLVVRAYCEFLYTHSAYESNGGYLPVAVLAAELGLAETADCAARLMAAGYAVFTLDYSGDAALPHATIYPEELSYAKTANAAASLYYVATSPKDTAWYVWMAMTWRAVWMLDDIDEADTSRLGIVGLRQGCNIAACLTALEDRVRCTVLIGNTGWHEYGMLYGDSDQISFFDDQSAGYNYSLSVESYAQFIKKPTLLMLGTNDPDNNFDRAFDTFARLSDRVKCALSVSPRSDGAVRYRERGNLIAWFDSNIRYSSPYPETPEIEAYVSSGRQYVKVTADERSTVRVYYAFSEGNYRVRNWFETVPEDFGGGKRIAQIDATTADRRLFCFAVAEYPDGVSVASRLAVTRPKECGVAAADRAPARLVYESSLGTDCFTTISAGALIDSRLELEWVKGPLELYGIQAVLGDLATFKFADERYAGYEGDLLTVNYYAPEACAVTFSLGVLRGRVWQEYAYTLRVQSGPLWQKETLKISDFKSAEGQFPASWEDVKRFRVKREPGRKFLISTLLWA